MFESVTSGGVLMQTRKIDPDMIRALVDEGLSAKQIARRVGWTVGTLRVRCSQLKISLRRSGYLDECVPYISSGSESDFWRVGATRHIDGYLGKQAGGEPPQNDHTRQPL